MAQTPGRWIIAASTEEGAMKMMVQSRIIAAMFMGACLAVPMQAHPGRDLAHRGAFTCDFELLVDPTAPLDAQAGVIDHDRQLMSSADAAEGFKHKVVPIFVDPLSGKTYAGGRYLFDRWAQARSYEKFVKEDFHTFDPGTGQIVQFLDRSVFANPDCRSWYVVGAAEFSDLETTQYQLRTERWSIPRRLGIIAFLESRWPQVKAAAKRIAGVSAIWLLVNREDRVVSIVYFQNRTGGFPTAGLEQLMSVPSVLAGYAARHGWTQIYQAGHLALNIWLPFQPGDQGPAGLWPNSDAIPLVPSPSDGVCSPSRGETSATDAACLATCGNAVGDAGETWLNCPADVSPYRN
jgi:hypothetical protein